MALAIAPMPVMLSENQITPTAFQGCAVSKTKALAIHSQILSRVQHRLDASFSMKSVGLPRRDGALVLDAEILSSPKTTHLHEKKVDMRGVSVMCQQLYWNRRTRLGGLSGLYRLRL